MLRARSRLVISGDFDAAFVVLEYFADNLWSRNRKVETECPQLVQEIHYGDDFTECRGQSDVLSFRRG